MLARHVAHTILHSSIMPGLMLPKSRRSPKSSSSEPESSAPTSSGFGDSSSVPYASQRHTHSSIPSSIIVVQKIDDRAYSGNVQALTDSNPVAYDTAAHQQCETRPQIRPLTCHLADRVCWWFGKGWKSICYA